jgi:hypothetical protein
MRTSGGSKCTMDQRKEGRRKLGKVRKGNKKSLFQGQES